MKKKLLKRDDYRIFEVDTVEMTVNDDVSTFYQIKAPRWVNVIAETGGKYLIVEQYRIGAEKVTLEFPGGIVDKGERAHAAGVRELREETGYSGNAEEIAAFYSNPAIMTNEVTVLHVRDCTKVSEPSLDEHEDIKVHLMSRDEIKAAISDGRFSNAIHIAAFYMFLSLE